GYGTVNTPNVASKPLTNNGSITGQSGAEPITLTGFVKGVGTFDNVVFTGTHAPGLSPAIQEVGSISYGPASVLLMELGGLLPGLEHDQILANGTLSLDATLRVELINGFVPQKDD